MRVSAQKLRNALTREQQEELRTCLWIAEHPRSVALAHFGWTTVALKLSFAVARLSRGRGAPSKSLRAAMLKLLSAAAEAPGIDSPLQLNTAEAQRAAKHLASDLAPALRRRRKGRPEKFRGLIQSEIFNAAGVLALATALRPGSRTNKECVLESLTFWLGSEEALRHLEYFQRRFSEKHRSQQDIRRKRCSSGGATAKGS